MNLFLPNVVPFEKTCVFKTHTRFTNIQHMCDTANSNLWHWSGHVINVTRDNVHVWHVSCLSSALSHQVSADSDWSTRNICQETSLAMGVSTRIGKQHPFERLFRSWNRQYSTILFSSQKFSFILVWQTFRESNVHIYLVWKRIYMNSTMFVDLTDS